jgi:hypothetical protein
MAQLAKRQFVIVGACVAAAVIVVIIASRGTQQRQSGIVEVVAAKRVVDSVVSNPSAEKSDLAPKTVLPSPKQRNFPEELKASPNYLIFARSTLAAAKAGDPNAQYYLGKVLGYCDAAYRSFFYRRSQVLSLDAALQYAIETGRSELLTKSIYDRCHELEEVQDKIAQFGIAADWIKKASDAGQPGAQSEEALAALQSVYPEPPVQAVGSAPEKTDPRSLLMAAVRSKDPEALWNIGDAQGLIPQSSDDKSINQFAWWLASCQLGLDCSSDSDRILMACQTKGCPVGLAGADFIRVIAGNNWQEVERRAQDITDKLNAEDWGSLDIAF